MSGRRQQDCSAEWRLRSARLVERTVALPPDPDALHQSPAAGGWSAAQVLEHLVLASGSYLAVMRQRVQSAPTAAAGTDLRWRPTLGGRLLAWSMTSARRLPAPRGWVPEAAPRPHVREAWIDELRELEALLDRVDRVPWNQVRFRSPVTALLRLNLGDGFLILISHAERHFGQIDRTLSGRRAGTP
jgi:hypothetical protein